MWRQAGRSRRHRRCQVFGCYPVCCALRCPSGGSSALAAKCPSRSPETMATARLSHTLTVLAEGAVDVGGGRVGQEAADDLVQVRRGDGSAVQELDVHQRRHPGSGSAGGQGAGRCRSRGRSCAVQRRGARQVLVILSIGCAQPTAPAVVPAAGQPATARASGAARRSTRAGGVPRRPTISRTWRAAGGRSGRRHQRSGRAGWVALVQSRDICPALVVRLDAPHHQCSPAPGPIPFHFQVSRPG